MHFGLHFLLPCADNQSPQQRYRDTIEQAVRGEALGFESVWPVEQHFNRHVSIMPCPTLLLAAIAERTSRLRLGTGIVQLPLAHPMRVAEELATLDVLSGGRVELGVGRGGNPIHFAGFGVSPSESRERLSEGLEFIVRAWTQDRFSFSGRFFQAQDIALSPQPLQRPHPPIRVAVNSPDTASWAGRAGHSIIVAANVNPFPKLPPLMAAYHAGRAESGQAPAAPDDVSLLMPLYVASSRDQARRELEPSVLHQAQLAAALADGALHKASEIERKALAPVLERMRNMNFDSVAENMGAIGTPADCIERIARLRSDLGIGRVISWFNFGGLVAHADVLRSMQLFTSEVMPHFQAGRRARAA
jgi:alkanesulfonate monooxygenase SsuD/methylene tetrahydromethanopterin reductase-like flavin-dependent oxidoreductase (luciferase family)